MVSPGPPGPSYSPPRTAGSVAARRVGRALGPAAPMDGIAAAAGLAVGTLYRHFPTEEALLEAAPADRIAESEAAARAVIDRVAGGADPADQVDALVRWYAEVHLQDRAWKAAAAAAGLAADLDRGEARAALDAAGELLRLAQSGGRIRADLTTTDLTPCCWRASPAPRCPPTPAPATSTCCCRACGHADPDRG